MTKHPVPWKMAVTTGGISGRVRGEGPRREGGEEGGGGHGHPKGREGPRQHPHVPNGRPFPDPRGLPRRSECDQEYSPPPPKPRPCGHTLDVEANK